MENREPVVPDSGGSLSVKKNKEIENSNTQITIGERSIISKVNPLKNYENAKFASKTHGLITSYAANTHQGIQRNYNEDRVSIILNMTKP